MAKRDAASKAPDNQDMTAADMAEKRQQTMEKVVARLNEISDRLELIVAAAKGSLIDMIAQDPLGRVVDTLEDFDLAIDGSKTANVVGLEGRLSELKAVLTYAREVSMPARMDTEEITTFNTDDNRITRTAKTYASIVDKDRAFAWLRENELDSLIQETVNSSSLSALAKELMEGGRELPSDEGDPFRVHIKDGVSITRKKK
jgi:hypothetical protein